MSWRIVTVSKEARLSATQGQLVITQDERHTLPLEDIGALVLESRAILLTTALMDACAQHKVAVYVCDEKHMPSAMLLPYQQHSRQFAVIEKQLAWSLPFKKRLWQRIVKQKIANQWRVLEHVTQKPHLEFGALIDAVDSGDSINREGASARIYFDRLLPAGSTRSADDHTNAGLNYGYAILRGAIARSLVAYGFLSSVGIAHKSELNNFNLADDLMEPYRPIIDLYVFSHIPVDGELTKEERSALVGLLTQEVILDGKSFTVLRAMEMTAQSLVTATEKGEYDSLLLPTDIIHPL
jgi:CRISP-associated protein Cas1